MMNAVDIILIILVAAALILAVVGIIRGKKRGNSCCGDCGKCGKAGGGCSNSR